MQTFASFLIPTLNRASTLKYAIASALASKSLDIEVIVSDNHSADQTQEICSRFQDQRLKVLKPPRPLAMHENYEYVLSNARGKWITIIGDDDAVMPHCVEHLRLIDDKYPNVEAIHSPRAYYFWKDHNYLGDPPRCSVSFMAKEVWRDSYRQLQDCLIGKFTYLDLPQIYSGGFQRLSLVKRIKSYQGGVYFKGVTPDAYSALMGVLHTYRYLEIGVPMTWVGTSPYHTWNNIDKSVKDRDDDFYGRMQRGGYSLNESLGRNPEAWPFQIYFLEAYLAARPFTDGSWLSRDNIHKVFLHSIKWIRLHNWPERELSLANELGFDIPSEAELNSVTLCSGLVPDNPIFIYSTSGNEVAHILSADSKLDAAYAEYKLLLTQK